MLGWTLERVKIGAPGSVNGNVWGWAFVDQRGRILRWWLGPQRRRLD
jgi:hypothetical protein